MFNSERRQIIAEIESRRARISRFIIAVSGPPAAGKSTLAQLLVDDLNAVIPGSAALVPMDGFHLDNAELDRQGWSDRKGAPFTFDADGFVALIKQIASAERDVSYPIFDRASDSVIKDGAKLSRQAKVIVVEGNYLLLDEPPWSELRDYFHFSVAVHPTLEILRQRLIARWLRYGYSHDEATFKAMQNDIPNAEYVLANSKAPDMHIGEN